MRKFKIPKQTRLFIIGLVLLILTSVTRIIDSKLPPVQQNTVISPTKIASSSASYIKVVRVIDGDTIEIESGQKVRYIGMDSPELHDPKKPVQCFANEAMLKNKELVEGKTVRMEKDVSEVDKYGRLLRYLYLDNQPGTSSALFINEYLVREGYASVSTFPPDVKYSELFRLAQREAMEKNRGLWNKCK